MYMEYKNVTVIIPSSLNRSSKIPSTIYGRGRASFSEIQEKFTNGWITRPRNIVEMVNYVWWEKQDGHSRRSRGNYSKRELSFFIIRS
jgi:hypothetical protein